MELLYTDNDILKIMAKKNTLLYLDEELVKKAKELNLNLSKIAENAIKLHMFPMMSTGERAAIDFNNYLRTLEKENRCYFIPFELKSIQLKNIGIHSNLALDLDTLNIIEGYLGEGKTTIIKSIAKTFRYETPSFHKLLSPGKETYKINIEIKPETKISLTYNEKNNNEFRENRTIRCIIIDEPMSRLSSSLINDFLYYLMGLNAQILLTNTPYEKIEYPREYKIIKLKQNIERVDKNE